MADTAPAGLTALTGAGTAVGDLFVITDVSAAADKKITAAEAFIGLVATKVQGAYTQTFSTASRTVSNPTTAAFTYPASGNLFDAIAADLLINVRVDSLANLGADVVTNVKSLADNVNQLITDVGILRQLINSLIDDSQAVGTAT